MTYSFPGEGTKKSASNFVNDSGSSSSRIAQITFHSTCSARREEERREHMGKHSKLTNETEAKGFLPETERTEYVYIRRFRTQAP